MTGIALAPTPPQPEMTTIGLPSPTFSCCGVSPAGGVFELSTGEGGGTGPRGRAVLGSIVVP